MEKIIQLQNGGEDVTIKFTLPAVCTYVVRFIHV